MIRAAAIVVCILVLSDAISDNLGLPVPGAGIGLILLAIYFAIRGNPDDGFGELFDFAAPYFPLFFVPAAVGVIASLDELQRAWFEISVAIVGGTAVTLVATGHIAQGLMRSKGIVEAR